MSNWMVYHVYLMHYIIRLGTMFDCSSDQRVWDGQMLTFCKTVGLLGTIMQSRQSWPLAAKSALLSAHTLKLLVSAESKLLPESTASWGNAQKGHIVLTFQECPIFFFPLIFLTVAYRWTQINSYLQLILVCIKKQINGTVTHCLALILFS